MVKCTVSPFRLLPSSDKAGWMISGLKRLFFIPSVLMQLQPALLMVVVCGHADTGATSVLLTCPCDVLSAWLLSRSLGRLWMLGGC